MKATQPKSTQPILHRPKLLPYHGQQQVTNKAAATSPSHDYKAVFLPDCKTHQGWNGRSPTEWTGKISAARKFEQKVAKFLKTPKDLHQSNFKITKDLHQRPPESQKCLHQSSKNRFFWQFSKSRPKSSQIAKSPKQIIGHQMVQKVAQIA